MKEKILVDIDGVLADFYAGFGDHLNKNLSAGLDLKNEPSEYSIHQWAPFLSRQDVDNEIPRWIISGGYKNMPIYPHAKDFLAELTKDFDVIIVTARVGDFHINFPPEVRHIIKQDTAKWFKEYQLPTDNIIFEHKKVDFCLEHGISTIIEDKLSTVMQAAEKGIKSILIDRGWNKERGNHPNVHVAKSYVDALNILREI